MEERRVPSGCDGRGCGRDQGACVAKTTPAGIRIDRNRQNADTFAYRIAPPSTDNRVVLARLSQGRRVITVKSGACFVSWSCSSRLLTPPRRGPLRAYARRSPLTDAPVGMPVLRLDRNSANAAQATFPRSVRESSDWCAGSASHRSAGEPALQGNPAGNSIHNVK